MGQIAFMIVFFFVIMNTVFLMMESFATDIGQTDISNQFGNSNFTNTNFTDASDELLNTRNFTIAGINFTGTDTFFDPILDAVDIATMGTQYIVRFITLDFIISAFDSFQVALGMEFPDGFTYVLNGVGGFLFFDMIAYVFFSKTLLPF
jgi:hypothetical protein